MMKKIISILLSLAFFLTPAVVYGDEAEEQKAAALKQLGLFQGVSETDFALQRVPTRTEALVMLIRLLGKEQEVNARLWYHPFTDVEEWADQYVGYGYRNGLTNGVSDTAFGAGDASCAMYLTFVLRALGYSDGENGDFSWSDPYLFAEQTGILPASVDTGHFLRGDIAEISYAALSVPLKGTRQTLAQKLVESGVFTAQQYAAACGKQPEQIEKEPAQRRVLTADEVFTKASPAVVYIQVYRSTEDYQNDQPCSSGSGFFISEDGVLVTNYHVIDSTLAATATTTDGYTYQIEQLLYFDIVRDLAVLQVSRQTTDGAHVASSFPYLTMQEQFKIGESVYALGNPLGLQSTFSDGIISNNLQTESGKEYIMTTAPIAPTSSGGALLNLYGEVVGITTSFLQGVQNMNMAIPVSYVQESREEWFSAPYPKLYQAVFKFLLNAETPEFAENIVEETNTAEPWNIEPISHGETISGTFCEQYNQDFYEFHTPIPVYLNVISLFIMPEGMEEHPLDEEYVKQYGMTWKKVQQHNFGLTLDTVPGEPMAPGEIQYDAAGAPLRVLENVYLEEGTYYISVFDMNDDFYEDNKYAVYMTLTPAE